MNQPLKIKKTDKFWFYRCFNYKMYFSRIMTTENGLSHVVNCEHLIILNLTKVI